MVNGFPMILSKKEKKRTKHQQQQCNTSPKHHTLNHWYDCFLPANGLMTWLPSQISLTYFCAGRILTCEHSSTPCTVLWANVHWMTWPVFYYPRMGAKCAEFQKEGLGSQFLLNTHSAGALHNQAWCQWSGFIQFPRQGAVCVLSPQNSQFGDLCNHQPSLWLLPKSCLAGRGG